MFLLLFHSYIHMHSHLFCFLSHNSPGKSNSNSRRVVCVLALYSVSSLFLFFHLASPCYAMSALITISNFEGVNVASKMFVSRLQFTSCRCSNNKNTFCFVIRVNIIRLSKAFTGCARRVLWSSLCTLCG